MRYIFGKVYQFRLHPVPNPNKTVESLALGGPDGEAVLYEPSRHDNAGRGPSHGHNRREPKTFVMTKNYLFIVILLAFSHGYSSAQSSDAEKTLHNLPDSLQSDSSYIPSRTITEISTLVDETKIMPQSPTVGSITSAPCRISPARRASMCRYAR